MKVVLVSPYSDITAFGLRTLSACLKEKGYVVVMVFMPDRRPTVFVDPLKPIYPPSVESDLVELCRDADIVGITLMTNFYDAAVQITRAVKSRLAVPVIWGGIHPTIRPEECLEHADLVCVGEGEHAFVELLERMQRGEAYDAIPNIWRKQDGQIVRTALRPLLADLSFLPLPDYAYEEHYAIDQGRIRRLDAARMKRELAVGSNASAIGKVIYETITSRGCPHNCAFCCNSNLRGLYSGQKYLRFLPVTKVIEELVHARTTMPFIEYIWISDDSFFARPLEAIREFCRLYKQRVGLPFFCLGSPLTISAEKMEALVDAGLDRMQVGVQTGSARIQRVFNRRMTNGQILEAANIIHRFQAQMHPPFYDFILDIPYETATDKVETLRLIAELPKPYHLNLFSLVMYPATELYEKACADGLIGDEVNDIYRKRYARHEPTYLNLLFRLCREGNMPRRLLQALIAPPLVAFFTAPFIQRLLGGGLKWVRWLCHGWKRIRGRPAGTPP